MNGIQFLVNPPKPVVRQGRLVKLIDLKETVPTGRPSTAHPKKEINARWYANNKEKVLELVKQYRREKRDLINRKRREKRAAEKAAREHAAMLRNSASLRRV